MRSYLGYLVLFILLVIAIIGTWGETRHTTSYGIAIAALFGLVVMKTLDKRQKKEGDS